MAHQNRVDPFGRLIATPEYGTLMGNRGCLHNDDRQIIDKPLGTTDAWITCVPEPKGAKRQLMRPGWYTELFFLDEPTALSAGHRPCGECRSLAYRAFKAAFVVANSDRDAPIRVVKHIDARMKADRRRRAEGLFERRKPSDLPDGAMFQFEDRAWLKLGDQALAWSFAGYGPRHPLPPEQVAVITPRSTLRALDAGYVCAWHETATEPPGQRARLPSNVSS